MDRFDVMEGQPYNVGLSDANLSKLELCRRIQRHVPSLVIQESNAGTDPDQPNDIVSNDKIDRLVTTYGVHNIKLADEIFVLNERHALGICDRIIERGDDLNISAYARVDTVKPSMLDTLKRARFNWLAIGIESASERVLSDVDKGYRVDDTHELERQFAPA